MRLLLLDYLLNAVWQAPAAALLGWLVAGLAPISAQAQSRVWQGAIWAAVLLPLLPEQHAAIALFNEWHPFAWHDPLRFGVALTHGGRATTSPSPIWIVLSQAGEARVTFAFLCLGLLGSARLAQSLIALIRLVRRCGSFDAPAEQALLMEVQQRRPWPRLVGSEEISLPATVGLFRPLILLPSAFAELNASETRAVLLHELEHVRRRDFASNLLVEIATLPLCWHPAVAFLKARGRAAREFACDAAAASQMREHSYAESLVSAVASFSRASAARPPRLAPSLLGGGDLVTRVRRLTSVRSLTGSAVAARLAASTVLGLGMLVLMAFAPLYPCAPAAYRAAHLHDQGRR